MVKKAYLTYDIKHMLHVTCMVIMAQMQWDKKENDVSKLLLEDCYGLHGLI